MKEKKFAYKHKPTNQWILIENASDLTNRGHIHFLEEFDSSILYSARNIIEEDLLNTKYGFMNFLEFKLEEIEVEYKFK